MSAGPAPAPEVGVWEAVLAGRPDLAGAYLVDAHAHIGPWFNFRIARPYAEGMLRTMDACGLHVSGAGKDEPGSSRRSVIEEHLLDVAAKRFASTGYRQTTLEEIRAKLPAVFNTQ